MNPQSTLMHRHSVAETAPVEGLALLFQPLSNIAQIRIFQDGVTRDAEINVKREMWRVFRCKCSGRTVSFL